MVTFTFGAEGVKIEEDLDKLVKLARTLIKAGLTSDSKKSLKKLLTEIQTIYNMMVKTVTPFYAINNDAKFESTFDSNYRRFKAIYLKGDVSNLDFSCKKVKKQLDNLTKNGKWYNKLGDIFLQSEKRKVEKETKLRNLEYLISDWFVSDKRVYGAMKRLQDQLNQGLDEVHNYKQLRLFLKDAEPRFKRIKTNQIKLRELSDEL